jgi:hypothetical protein
MLAVSLNFVGAGQAQAATCSATHKKTFKQLNYEWSLIKAGVEIDINDVNANPNAAEGDYDKAIALANKLSKLTSNATLRGHYRLLAQQIESRATGEVVWLLNNASKEVLSKLLSDANVPIDSRIKVISNLVTKNKC